MTKHHWKSSPLQHVIENPNECAVCAFLAGDRSPETLLVVIQCLDEHLAAKEVQNKRLLEAVTSMAQDIAEHGVRGMQLQPSKN